MGFRTKEQQQIANWENMTRPEGKSCQNCHWSGYIEGDMFVTCGMHILNLKSTSMCEEWTSFDDPNLKAWLIKKAQRLKDKMEAEKRIKNQNQNG